MGSFGMETARQSMHFYFGDREIDRTSHIFSDSNAYQQEELQRKKKRFKCHSYEPMPLNGLLQQQLHVFENVDRY
ncbi:hypothetical protein OUZ56_002096 [Daphnia magna]|uniref:Uncharacterized protein n=1 Tax=Daphnia magna TaxID=35525 RepID=A0ABR0A4P5_9CRUS|nr:hypothetical protein OUZ56_002096 [Daphnia magna]